MDLKQNPFSLYDFLGYLVPGAFFLYGSYCFITHSLFPSELLSRLAGVFQPDKWESYLPFVLLSYVTGHALSFISSITVERYSVWRVGYPSKYLLGNPFPSYFDVKDPKCIRKLVRFVVAIFLAPITVLDLAFSWLFRLNELFAKPLDNVITSSLPPKITRFLATCAGLQTKPEKVKSGESEFFRLVYHFTVEHAPAHLSKMQNYIALYGFCRTISVIFVLAFWVALIAIVRELTDFVPAIAFSLGAGIISYLFFLNFLKFYRRFSQEVLVAFAVVYTEEFR